MRPEQIRTIFPTEENTLYVIMITPYYGYEIVFRGSTKECSEYIMMYRIKNPQINHIYNIEDDLSIMIVSHKLLLSAKEYNATSH